MISAVLLLLVPSRIEVDDNERTSKMTMKMMPSDGSWWRRRVGFAMIAMIAMIAMSDGTDTYST